MLDHTFLYNHLCNIERFSKVQMFLVSHPSQLIMSLVLLITMSISDQNVCVFYFLQMCEQAGEDLVPCEGQCCGMFHLHCLGLSLKPDEKLLCQECSTG